MLEVVILGLIFMNWNIGKNMLVVVTLGLIFIGVPILLVNLLGVSDAVYSWGLTGQESAGVLVYVAALFVFWRVNTK